MKIKKSIILLLAIVLIILSCLSFNYLIDSQKHFIIGSKSGLAVDSLKSHINPNITIISHRGASGEAVEHTFEAYDKAINEGNTLIEQDLQTSKDGTLWVSHDNFAGRITGTERNYSDMSDEEIFKLHAENGEPIHILDDVLGRYCRNRNIIFVIELKNGSSQVDSFLKSIRKNDVVNRTIVQSFEYDAIDLAIKKQPNLISMFLAEEVSAIENHIGDNIDIICFDKMLLKDNIVKKIRNSGKLAYLYTLNTVDEFNKAKSMGIDGFFTNFTQA